MEKDLCLRPKMALSSPTGTPALEHPRVESNVAKYCILDSATLKTSMRPVPRCAVQQAAMGLGQAFILLIVSSLVVGDSQWGEQGLKHRRLLQTPSSCACVCGGVHEGYVQGVSS